MALGSALGGAVISSAGKMWSDRKNRKTAQAENNRQYDLARNSIKYRVEDAKNAGIHPLYALGGETMGSTVSQASQSNPMAEIGQAIANNPSKTTHQDQMETLAFQQANENVRNIRLQNDLLKQDYLHKKLDATKKISNDEDALKVMGAKVNKHKGWSDTQDMEDRYGDPLSWIYGLGVLGADTWKNYKDWSETRTPYKPKSKRKAHRYK